MFDVDRYSRKLDTQWLGHECLSFDQLPSTNSYLKRISGEEISHGMICLADNQLKGRGQYERNWESSPGDNLTFTIAFKPGQAERLHVLTLACAWATVELIEQVSSCCAYIKWPNDVMVGGKKIGGLLTESVFSGNSLDRVLVGIGFNVNQESFGGELAGQATSLRIEEGETFSRERLMARLLGAVECAYTRWHQNDVDMLRSINRKLEGYGQWIRLSVNGETLPATYKLVGVNEKGELTVINEESSVKTFSHEQIRIITD